MGAPDAIPTLDDADALARLLRIEAAVAPSADQTRLEPMMRRMLVDWCIYTQLAADLEEETLFLTVHVMDRFIATLPAIQYEELVLSGAVAVFVASKYVEVQCLTLTECASATDDTFTREQMLQMELRILRAVGFDLAYPTAWIFATRFLEGLNASVVNRATVMYLIELALYHVPPFPGSAVAAGAIAVALRREAWCPAGVPAEKVRLAAEWLVGLNVKAVPAAMVKKIQARAYVTDVG